MARFAHITGWGMSVPDQILTNDDIAKIVDTTDEWIQDRTGIQERRIANAEESPATLADQPQTTGVFSPAARMCKKVLLQLFHRLSKC